ncbi:hypothetical protein D9M69_515010 [compost metagenome]
MKLHTENHLFLLEVALRLKVDQDHMIKIFNTLTASLLNADDTAKTSFNAYVDGKISKEELNADLNSVGDLIVVRAAYDKLSDACIEAFNAVSSYHMSRMDDDPAYATN